jgi:hypothetical protein
MSWLDCLCCYKKPHVTFVNPLPTATTSVTRINPHNPSAVDDKIRIARERNEKEREHTPAPKKFDQQKANVTAKRHRRLESTEVVSVNTMFKTAQTNQEGQNG